MGDRLGILGAVGHLFLFYLLGLVIFFKRLHEKIQKKLLLSCATKKIGQTSGTLSKGSGILETVENKSIFVRFISF